MECPYNRPSECTVSFCLSKQNIINLSKRRGPFSFHKHRKQSKLAEHFEYNHIPAHLSSVQNLHFKSILCTHDGLAIVHLARNLITQFGIVDLHIHKFLGTFGRQTVKYSTDSVAAQISPDGSLCLVRLPWSRTNRITTLQVSVKLKRSPQSDIMQTRRRAAISIKTKKRDLPFMVSTINFQPPVHLLLLLLLPPPPPFTPPNVKAKTAQTKAQEVANAHSDDSPRRACGRKKLKWAVRGDWRLYNLRTKELVTELPLTTDNIRFRPVPPPPPPPPQPQPPSLRLPFVHPFLTLGWTTPDDLENQTRSSQSARRPAPNEVEEEEAEVRVRAFGGYNQPASILFDFDPRFENSRIALANVHFVEPQRPDCPTLRRYSLVEGFFEGQEPILCLVRLPSWQRIAKTRNFGETPEPRVGSVGAGNLRGRGTSDGAFNSATATGINILKVFYSRAGHLIFAVVATTMSCRCNSLAQGLLFSPFHPSGTDATGSTSAPDVSEHRGWGFGGVAEASEAVESPGSRLRHSHASPPPGCTSLFITVFHGDTLDTLRVIRFDRPICPLHTCPTNYIPVMSKCGSRMALVALATVGGDRSVAAQRRGGKGGGGRRVTSTSLADVSLECAGGGTPRRKRTSTLNVPSPRPGSSHIPFNHTEHGIDWETSLMEYDLNQAEPVSHVRSSVIDSGNCSPGTRKLQEVVFVYQLDPPPTLQAIVRQKIRQILPLFNAFQYFPDSALDNLGLPPGIVAYLRFKPSFACSGSCLSRSASVSTLQTLRSNSLELH
ncbi:unnamed protein product [Mesocestoides corti]|uniref:SOCS box domain-containing protein n=1 Tax=Mesocestoides corti TaxID=53468 RepID=A0A0R3U5E2_MESCO|nr:unnamed protein product [Mesocestoides corti]